MNLAILYRSNSLPLDSRYRRGVSIAANAAREREDRRIRFQARLEFCRYLRMLADYID